MNKKLSPKPLEVFDVPMEGISLVEASAGTGKTYNITSLYLRAILEKHLMPPQILVLTFTEDATSELKTRLRSRLNETITAIERDMANKNDTFLQQLLQKKYPDALANLKSALSQFDEASVFTIHGFCHRLLNEYSLQFGVNPDFDVIPDETTLLQDCVDDFWRKLNRADKSVKDQFILRFLIEKDVTPDNLLEILKKVINRPYVKLIPEADLAQLKSRIPDFLNSFEEIKNASEEELKELQEILFHEGLNKKKYGENKKITLWSDLNSCMQEEFPKIYFIDLLKDLGTNLCESAKKGYHFEEPGICRKIQEFCDIGEEFNELKPAFVIQSIAEITSDYERRKASANTYSYDDFLLKVNNGLSDDSSGQLSAMLAEKYPAALVDEFQDTDPIQYNIFKQIYHDRAGTALFMIGDPKQAIYGFRGADIYTYIEARKDVTPGQKYSLNFNYRSNDQMIESVNEIFTLSDSPFLLDELSFSKASFPPDKEKIYLRKYSEPLSNPLHLIKLESDKSLNKGASEKQVSNVVVDEVTELLNGSYSIQENLQPKDIAVLVRTSKQGEMIQNLLRKKGIKSILKSKSSVFESAEAKELFYVLQAIHKSHNEPGIRTALLTNLLGFTADEIHQLLYKEDDWTQILYHFTEARLLWEDENIEKAFQYLNKEFKIFQNLTKFINAERKITNVNHLLELLSKAETEQHLHSLSLLKWLNAKISDNNSKSENENLRLESDENLIQITTIHASKGLEYPVVLCPFLWVRPRNPDRNSVLQFFQDGKIHIDINTGVKNTLHEQLHLVEEYRESIRLLYVALTRSANACFVFLPNFNSFNESALAKATGCLTVDDLVYKVSDSPNIKVRQPVEPQEINVSQVVEYNAQSFNRKNLMDFPKIISFTSLSESLHRESMASEEIIQEDFGLNATEQDESSAESYNRFTFVKGASAGTFLHRVFEDIDFERFENVGEIIVKNMELAGIEKKWEQSLTAWVIEALEHPLGTNSIKLSSLKSTDVLKEMEFYFPADGTTKKELWQLIKGKGSYENIDQKQLNGFMKGYIDLIYRTNGKYYILDYKSNYLGDTAESYQPEALADAMLSSNYDLQYHIYTIALHRLLKQKVADYHYDTHFGGVQYVFLRGIDKNTGGSGVYFNRPEKKLIEQLDELFMRKVTA